MAQRVLFHANRTASGTGSSPVSWARFKGGSACRIVGSLFRWYFGFAVAVNDPRLFTQMFRSDQLNGSVNVRGLAWSLIAENQRSEQAAATLKPDRHRQQVLIVLPSGSDPAGSTQRLQNVNLRVRIRFQKPKEGNIADWRCYLPAGVQCCGAYLVASWRL